jgi:hypothetical protein
MAAEQSTGISTWDVSPPYIPGLPDYNGAALINDAEAPPTPGDMPTANLMNGTAFIEISLAQTAPSLIVSVTYSGGNPAFDSGTTAAGVSPGATSPYTSAAIVLERTPTGASHGDITVYWPANTFPPHRTRPTATINGSTPGVIACDWYTDTGGHSGVRIVTQNLSGTATDLPFTVVIL